LITRKKPVANIGASCENKGISQKRLEMSGLKQPAIARLECMQATPQIDTLFKVLKPLGYTLAIVPDRAET